jgi:hypothetical protein
MNFGKGGLRIPEATSSEVKDTVALTDEAIEINGNGFVLLHISQPLPWIEY